MQGLRDALIGLGAATSAIRDINAINKEAELLPIKKEQMAIQTAQSQQALNASKYALEKQQEKDAYDQAPLVWDDVLSTGFPDATEGAKKMLNEYAASQGWLDQSTGGNKTIQRRHLKTAMEQLQTNPRLGLALTTQMEKDLSGSIAAIDQQLANPDIKPKDQQMLTEQRASLANKRQQLVQENASLKRLDSQKQMSAVIDKWKASGAWAKMPYSLQAETELAMQNGDLATFQGVLGKVTANLTKRDLSTTDTELFLQDPAQYEEKVKIDNKYKKTGSGSGDADSKKEERQTKNWAIRDEKNRSQAMRKAAYLANTDKSMSFSTDETGKFTMSGGSAKAREIFEQEYNKLYGKLTLQSVKNGSLDSEYINNIREGDLWNDVAERGLNAQQAAKYLAKSYGYDEEHAKAIVARGVQYGTIKGSPAAQNAIQKGPPPKAEEIPNAKVYIVIRNGKKEKVTEADIQMTAQKYNVTPEQVKAQLGIK